MSPHGPSSFDDPMNAGIQGERSRMWRNAGIGVMRAMFGIVAVVCAACGYICVTIAAGIPSLAGITLAADITLTAAIAMGAVVSCGFPVFILHYRAFTDEFRANHPGATKAMIDAALVKFEPMTFILPGWPRRALR